MNKCISVSKQVQVKNMVKNQEHPWFLGSLVEVAAVLCYRWTAPAAPATFPSTANANGAQVGHFQ